MSSGMPPNGSVHRNRWSRRYKLGVAVDNHVHSDAHLERTVNNASETRGEDIDFKVEQGTASCTSAPTAGDEHTIPENLRVLLACSLDSIETGQQCSRETDHGIKELAGLMAQRGLYPRSKLVSAQHMMLEHSLAESYNRVLGGGARHIRGVYGDSRDLGLFDALRLELGRGEGAWSRGTKGSARIKWSVPGLNGCGLLDGEIVQDLHGQELPAFSYVLRTLADSVDANILSWWVNIYEEGSVGLGFHHDHQSNNNGLRWGRIFDVTAGASFGACRDLTFRHGQSSREFHFPQANGDIFAFDTQTDVDFLHGIYRQKQPCGPRISVIIVGKSHAPAS